MTTRSTEDYLKNIYHLQRGDEKVNTTTLASALKISPASVSEMISKLSKAEWIKNIPYSGFRLTKKGEKEAIKLVRKHRLLEVFLNQHLNYEWDEVHEEAEKLEHVVSDKFINKLEDYLGCPKFDPHGYPIPDVNGHIANTHARLLSDSAEGKAYIVTQVSDDSRDILHYISQLGIKLNSKIFLTEKLSFDNSVIITFKNKNHLLSKVIAENIFVVSE